MISVEFPQREPWPRRTVLAFMLGLSLCGAPGMAETYLAELQTECACFHSARGEN